MGKVLAVLTALALVAAAFFLPAWLAQWRDRQLLDVPHITAHEAQEGFAKSLQLTPGEKLLLLRGGDLSSMYVGGITVEGLYITPKDSGDTGTIERGAVASSSEELPGPSGEDAYSPEDLPEALDSASVSQSLELWDQRLRSVWLEVRSLQSLGGLPSLWPPGCELEYVGWGDLLYVDGETHVSFQTYSIALSGYPYSLDMSVDSQSGRILSFDLSWAKDTQLNWGLSGSATFGPAWRDYWKLNGVDAGWYSPYNKEILECTEDALRRNGSYNANGVIRFTYDGRSLPVNLFNWVDSGQSGELCWNIYGARAPSAREDAPPPS